MADQDIFRNYNFILDVGAGPVGYFTQVDGLSIDIETIDYREGGAGPAVRKLAGRPKYGDVTLKWGMTEDRMLWDWLMSAASGIVERRHVSIILVSSSGTEKSRWNLFDTWPTTWRGAALDAMANEAAIETITLACEGIERA